MDFDLSLTWILGTFLSAAITQNILLSKFLGMCSFLAVSKSMKTAVGLGIAVLFVTVSTAVINFLVATNLLVPLNLEFLGPLLYIMIIAGFVQLVEMIIERFSPVLYVNLGIYLPLITVNCAILGITDMVTKNAMPGGWLEVFFRSMFAGVGWMIAICLMAGIRTRLVKSNIPKPLDGLGITLMITAMMALAFSGFAGLAIGGGH